MLILGGARSGKSVTAERMLAARDQVDYVATGPLPDAGDPEWADRVRLHRQRRPAHWTTLETLELEGVLTGAGLTYARLAVPVLVDCLSTWLAGVMEEAGLWAGEHSAGRHSIGEHSAGEQSAGERVAERVDGLLGAWRSTRRHVVAVSNEVGSGVVPATASGVRFRDELGVLNARVAAESEQVWLCTAGIARRLR